jgi:hypothetical protein
MTAPAPKPRFQVQYSDQWYRTWVIWCTTECVVWAGPEAPESDDAARMRAAALAEILASSVLLRDAAPTDVRRRLTALCGQPLQTGEFRANNRAGAELPSDRAHPLGHRV